jgi:hypothetical protein
MFCKSIILYTKVSGVLGVTVISTVTMPEFLKNINLMLAKCSIRCEAPT